MRRRIPISHLLLLPVGSWIVCSSINRSPADCRGCAGWDVHQRVRVLELGGHGGQTPRAGLLQQGQAGRVPLTLSASMVLFSIQDYIKSRLSIIGTDFLLSTPVSNPCYYCKVIFNAMLNTVSYSLLLLIKRID